ncbi:MAG: Bor family protein [Alistipes sp.]|nr:Bor family protein [Alistipes sp.]
MGGGICALLSLTSCYSTRVMHGDVKPNEPVVQVNRQWNHHLIGGLVPVGKNKLAAAEYVNDTPNYVVKTNQNFLNLLVSCVTCGIYTPTQTKFYIPLRELQGAAQDMPIKTDE